MDNNVYLLSSNLNLIKSFVNYDSISRVFKLKDLSTISMFDINIIDKNHYAIIIIDHVGNVEEHIQLLKYLRHKNKDKLIKIVYTYPKIDYRIINELKHFSCYKVLVQPLDFFYFIYWLEKSQTRIQKNEFFMKEIEVNAYLNHLGISTRLLGFIYLKEAILLKMNQSKMKLVEICDKIAREHQTTSSRVERCMRTAIGNSYEKNETLFMGLSISRRPSCMDFIAKLVNYIVIPNKE